MATEQMRPEDVPGELAAKGADALGWHLAHLNIHHIPTLEEQVRAVLVAVLPEARKLWFAELFGTPEEIAAREAEAATRSVDDTVALCERARPGEHERRVRAEASAELMARAEPYRDALTGPRASFRRGMEAAARHIAPKSTPREIVEALASGEAVAMACNVPEPGDA